MAFSSDLIRFISGIPVLNDGTIPLNNITDDDAFESKLYKPTYALTVLSRITQNELNNGTIEVTNDALDSNTIVMKALNSNLSSFSPDIYLLLKAVVLESFSLLYNIENSPKNLQYVSARDIRTIKTNTNFIADFFSTDPKYYHMIENMREMNISFGYIENQIDVIMVERGGR
ncbi:hypothetical protein [Bacillus licheniformis]